LGFSRNDFEPYLVASRNNACAPSNGRMCHGDLRCIVAQ
jgi:hypothetical protein